MSSVDDKVFFVSVKVIFNLWAPGALTLEVPWALSFKLASSPGVVNASFTDKPTLYDGVFVYLSNSNEAASIFTKKPFI